MYRATKNSATKLHRNDQSEMNKQKMFGQYTQQQQKTKRTAHRQKWWVRKKDANIHTVAHRTEQSREKKKQ